MLVLAAAAIAVAVELEDVSDLVPIEVFGPPVGDGKVGVALFDPDRDGDLDLYIANGPTRGNLLYRNDGGAFTEVAADVGAQVTSGTSGVLAADLDGDGWTDLLLAGDGGLAGPRDSPVVLLRNLGDGTFQDVDPAHSGVTGAETNIMASAADIDGDDDLDVFIAAIGAYTRGVQHRNTLYRNDGDLRFTEIGAEAGVDTDLGACASTFTHVDDDDAIDLLVANCNDVRLWPTPFEVYLNDGTGHFTDARIDQKVFEDGYWMGLALGDFDNNGLMDFFSTNIGGVYDPHVLYMRTEDGIYSEQAVAAGVADWEFGWGAVAPDVDNDGDVDLYYVGASQPGRPGAPPSSPGHLFLNDGHGVFAPPTQPVDLTELYTTGLAHGDLFGNGFPDLVVTTAYDPVRRTRGFPVLLRNHGNDNHWLTVRLHKSSGNTRGVGARIRATTGERVQLREIHAGTSFVSSNTPWPTFGLRESTEVSLCVRWPDGRGEDFGTFDADQVVDLRYGEGVGEAPCTGTTSAPPAPADTGAPVGGRCGCATGGTAPGWLLGMVLLAVRIRDQMSVDRLMFSGSR